MMAVIQLISKLNGWNLTQLLLCVNNKELYIHHLTAFVRTALWRAVKNNGSTRRRVAYWLKEQKRSRYEQSTLLIKDFKYGPSLSILVRKFIIRQLLQISQFFVTIITLNKRIPWLMYVVNEHCHLWCCHGYNIINYTSTIVIITR